MVYQLSAGLEQEELLRVELISDTVGQLGVRS